MNKTFFQKNKNAFYIAAAIVAFAVITLVYFSPILEGKRIKQHDIEMHAGMSQEINQYRQATGEQTLWTNTGQIRKRDKRKHYFRYIQKIQHRNVLYYFLLVDLHKNLCKRGVPTKKRRIILNFIKKSTIKFKRADS